MPVLIMSRLPVLQELVHLYEAGRKFDIAKVLLPMPGYIASCSWEGQQKRLLLSELYSTDGPEPVQKAALAKLLAAPGDVNTVLRHPRSSDLAHILRKTFPTMQQAMWQYLRSIHVLPLCYQSASDLLNYLHHVAKKRKPHHLLYAVESSYRMHIKLAPGVSWPKPNVPYPSHLRCSTCQTRCFTECIRILMRHLMYPHSGEWVNKLQHDD